MSETMSTLLRPIAFFAAVHLLGCGSSSPRNTQGTAPPAVTSDSGVEDTPSPPPVRTLKTATLLPGSSKNLLLDPFFSANSPEWGHFFASFGSGGSSTPFDRRVFGASPGGVGAPIAILKDPAATDTRSKALTFMSSFLGGPGPYQAHIWASSSNAAGEPRAFPAETAAFRVTITAAIGASGSAFDLVRDEGSRTTFGDREWFMFAAKIDASITGGGFFNVRCGTTGGSFQVTLPEIVPTSLLGPGTMSLERAAVARPMDEEERAMARAYMRIPVRLEGARKEKVSPPGAVLEPR